MMTAGIVQGKVITATGLLQLFQSYVDQTTLAWGAFPALLASTAMIHSLIRKIKKEGVDSIDPLEAKEVADGLRHISEKIRRLDARADMARVTEHLPFRMCIPRLRAQGRVLSRIAQDVYDLDQEWKQTIERAATEKCASSKQQEFSLNLDSIDWSEAELYDMPERELAEHHYQNALGHKSSNC
jgi:hypothetical protein